MSTGDRDKWLPAQAYWWATSSSTPSGSQNYGLKMKRAKMSQQDIMTKYAGAEEIKVSTDFMVGRPMARYLFTENGLGFFVRQLDRPTHGSAIGIHEDGVDVVLANLYENGYLLSTTASQPMMTLGHDLVVVLYLEEVGGGRDSLRLDDPFPPIIKLRHTGSARVTSSAGSAGAGINWDYGNYRLRAEGIERYDPEFAIDPAVLNIPGGRQFRRNDIAYDEEGNPVGVDDDAKRRADEAFRNYARENGIVMPERVGGTVGGTPRIRGVAVYDEVVVADDPDALTMRVAWRELTEMIRDDGDDEIDLAEEAFEDEDVEF